MACEIVDEEYDGLNALNANAGQWVAGTIDFFNLFSVGSGNSNKFTVDGNAITIQSGQWGDFGLAAGMNITITFTDFSLNPPSNPVVFNTTIDYINGNILYMTAVLGIYTDNVFPTTGSNGLSGMLIEADESPQSAEFFFNLVKNGTNSDNSVIDQEVNKFIYNDLNNLAPAASAAMTQENNKSGGYLKDVIITRNADVGFKRNYTIDFTLLQWGLIQDGNVIPSYYDANDNLVPFITVNTFFTFGNPNGSQTANNGATQASTGFLNENFNGGQNDYDDASIVWKNLLGETIEKMDYSDASDFTATINATGQDTVQSIYRIGMFYSPLDASVYQNKPQPIVNNLLMNAPDQDFNHSVTPDVTLYQGFINDDGARLDFINLQFEIVGSTVVVTGRVIPNAAASAYFAQFPDGERKMIMFVQIGDYLLTANLSNQVNLTIYEDDNIDAPVRGVQYPFVQSEVLEDISNLDITSTVFPNTTTEDSILYKSQLLIDNDQVVDGIRMRIFARNDVTEEEFTVAGEDNFINFANVPFISGKYEANVVLNRSFNLPPTTDRNIISLVRDASIDSGSQYGLAIEYGFQSNWRYWLAQQTVNDFFFDLAEPNDGKNQNWQRFTNGDWQLYFGYYVRINDVDDFQELLIKTRPYEDDVTVTSARTFTNLSNMTNPNALVADELMELEVKFLWPFGFTSPWVEFTIENFENGNRWEIDTIHDQGGVSANPFKPLTGETKIQLTNLGTTLVAKCIIDTSLIDVNNVSLSYRVSSLPKDEDHATGKQSTDGMFKATTDGQVKQKTI